MPTLLEIYDSYTNGQNKQFADQVLEYGADDFAADLQTDITDDILTYQEAYEMLRTFIILEADRNQ